MSVDCLIVMLRRQLKIEGFIVGAVWHEGHRHVRVRAILPRGLRSRSEFHLDLLFRFELIERTLAHLLIRRVTPVQFGPYIDLTAEVEAAT